MSRWFPPIDPSARCDCFDATYPLVRDHYPWEHVVFNPWSPMPTGPAMWLGRSDRSFEEHYVVADLIEALLSMGYDARHMALERTIERGARPDLTVEPHVGAVELWEAKRSAPLTKDRAQAARYAEVGHRVWPDRVLRVFLVWPAIERTAGRGSPLRVEQMS